MPRGNGGKKFSFLWVTALLSPLPISIHRLLPSNRRWSRAKDNTPTLIKSHSSRHPFFTILVHIPCKIMAALLIAAPPIRRAQWQTVLHWGFFINSAAATTKFCSCQKQGHVLSNKSSQYSREEKCHHLRKIPSLSICLVALIWFFSLCTRVPAISLVCCG